MLVVFAGAPGKGLEIRAEVGKHFFSRRQGTTFSFGRISAPGSGLCSGYRSWGRRLFLYGNNLSLRPNRGSTHAVASLSVIKTLVGKMVYLGLLFRREMFAVCFYL